jgi:O-antigen/teichoic acid export membrane protein
VKPLTGKLRQLAKHDVLSLIGGSAFIVILRISGVAVTYLTQIVLARWMGAVELGHYVFAFSGCVVLSLISTLGLPGVGFRFIPQYEIAGDPGKVVGFVRRAQEIIFLSSLIVAGIAICAVVFLDSEDSAQLLTRALAYACVPFFALLTTGEVIARSLSLLLLAILPNLLLRQLLLLAGIVVVHLFLGNLSAVVVVTLMLFGVSVLAVGQSALLHRHLATRFNNVAPSYETRVWLRTGLPLLAGGAFTQFSQECNVLVAGFYLPPEQLAVFNAAYRTSSFVNFGMAAITMMVSPALSRLFFSKDKSGLQRLVAQQAQVRFLFAAGAVTILVLLGKYLLGFFGEEFIVGYRPLLILIAANLFVGAIGPVLLLLSIGGYQKRCAVVFAFAIAATVLANITLVPLFGIDGAAMAVFVVTVFWTTWLYVLVVRHLGIQPSILGFRHAIR